jgi:hypothetical protein
MCLSGSATILPNSDFPGLCPRTAQVRVWKGACRLEDANEDWASWSGHQIGANAALAACYSGRLRGAAILSLALIAGELSKVLQ